MKKILITLCTLLLNVGVNAQTLEWAKSFGGSTADEGQSITVDASGNIYTIGYFSGTVDFDPGAGTANLTYAGSYDVFIQKLDASGNFLWTKSFGGTANNWGMSIAVDALGNVYSTGYFAGVADFDPGEGTANFTSLGSFDGFIQKLDASGNFLWAKHFGSGSYEQGSSIALDGTGNVYITGHFRGMVDFDPGEGTANLSSMGLDDIFILKLDTSGNFVWSKSFGGSFNDNGVSTKLDSLGNIYTTGFFSETVDFDPGIGTANLTSAGGKDVFIQKLDASGNFQWAKRFGGSSDDFGYSLTLDASGYIYTTGYFTGTTDFDPGVATANLTSAGSKDVFIQKLDVSGNYLWAKRFGGSFDDLGHSITVDNSGNVYTAGYFKGTVDFDPGVGTANLTSPSFNNVFVQKLDTFGNFIWAKSFGGNSDNDEGNSILADASGNVYITGYFKGTADFDPGAGTANLTSAGSYDVFVLKMSDLVTGFDEIAEGIQIKVFPNPSNGLIQLTFEQTLNNVAIRVTDLQGKLIFTKQLDTAVNEQINIDGTPGIYFLSVKTPQGQSVLKLIKE